MRMGMQMELSQRQGSMEMGSKARSSEQERGRASRSPVGDVHMHIHPRVKCKQEQEQDASSALSPAATATAVNSPLSDVGLRTPDTFPASFFVDLETTSRDDGGGKAGNDNPDTTLRLVSVPDLGLEELSCLPLGEPMGLGVFDH